MQRIVAFVRVTSMTEGISHIYFDIVCIKQKINKITGIMSTFLMIITTNMFRNK